MDEICSNMHNGRSVDMKYIFSIEFGTVWYHYNNSPTLLTYKYLQTKRTDDETMTIAFFFVLISRQKLIRALYYDELKNDVRS